MPYARKPIASAKQFRAPRGVADILPEDRPYWRWLTETAARIAGLHGYQQIETPVIEDARVYLRPGAAGTDVADKEVYLFEDRGGDQLALPPEGTAARPTSRSYAPTTVLTSPRCVAIVSAASRRIRCGCSTARMRPASPSRRRRRGSRTTSIPSARPTSTP